MQSAWCFNWNVTIMPFNKSHTFRRNKIWPLFSFWKSAVIGCTCLEFPHVFFLFLCLFQWNEVLLGENGLFVNNTWLWYDDFWNHRHFCVIFFLFLVNWSILSDFRQQNDFNFVHRHFFGFLFCCYRIFSFCCFENFYFCCFKIFLFLLLQVTETNWLIQAKKENLVIFPMKKKSKEINRNVLVLYFLH